MSILVVADHDNESIKAPTLVSVAAAQQMGGDIDVLVAGSSCAAAGDADGAGAGVAGEEAQGTRRTVAGPTGSAAAARTLPAPTARLRRHLSTHPRPPEGTTTVHPEPLSKAPGPVRGQ